MKRIVPPLKALRAFEAAARLESVTKAAEELNVSSGAVSRQIKLLEAWFGVALFERGHRKIVMTDYAATYLRSISQAFDIIEQATVPLRSNQMHSLGHQDRASLKICSYPSVTELWLIPKLKGFFERYPQIDTRFSISMTPDTGIDTSIDAVIVTGSADTHWGGRKAIKLFDIGTMLVCSPELHHRKPMATADDLSAHTLLRIAPRLRDWSKWLELIQVDDINPNQGPIFETSSLAVQAAKVGAGLLLIEPKLVIPELRNGTLIHPFGPVRTSHHGIYLVFSTALQNQWQLKVFIDWVTEP